MREDTKVNQARFLAWVLLIAIAYSLATIHGQWIEKLGVEIYAGRISEHQDKTPRQSEFSRSPLWTTVDLWDGIMERLGNKSNCAQAP